MRGRDAAYPSVSRDEVFAHLVDAEVGLCAHDSRFNEAHVVAAIAAQGAGRLDLARIEELAGDFLSSEHVVRLVEVGWRLGDAARIQAELDHHRASVTLGAVRQGDPLAFGIDRLRGARATYAADLSALEAALPADRSRELAQAKSRVASDRRSLADARARKDEAEQARAVAQERHWGRRDKEAIRAAGGRLDHADAVVTAAETALAGHAKELADERAATREREAAVAASAPERTRLDTALRELDLALDTTRPGRVVAIATGGDLTEPVVQALGPLPATRGGQRVWCALASEIERDRDRGVWSDPTEDAVLGGRFARMSGERGASEPLDNLIHLGTDTDSLPATVPEPRAWARQLEDARDVIRFARQVERPGLDLELGL